MKNYCLLLLFPFLFTGCNDKNSGKITTEASDSADSTVVYKIAHAHGLQHFDDIKVLEYTFNVRVDDSLRSQRSWRWEPDTGRVTLSAGDSTITYNQQTEAEDNPSTDQRFINDKYWLLFPYQLVWDEMEYEHEEDVTAPISGEQMQRLTVTYPDDAGYTPGDVYEVYFGDDYIIREWIFRSGGQEEPSLVSTWEEYENHKSMKIATMHRDAEGNFELFFSDLEVE